MLGTYLWDGPWLSGRASTLHEVKVDGPSRSHGPPPKYAGRGNVECTEKTQKGAARNAPSKL